MFPAFFNKIKPTTSGVPEKKKQVDDPLADGGDSTEITAENIFNYIQAKKKFISGNQFFLHMNRKITDYLKSNKLIKVDKYDGAEWTGDLYYSLREDKLSKEKQSEDSKILNVSFSTYTDPETAYILARFEGYKATTKYPRFAEEKTFPGLDANTIPNSPWIAASGPSYADSESLSRFLKAISNSEKPVDTIVALGEKIALKEGDENCDFMNYFLMAPGETLETKNFSVATKEITDDYDAKKDGPTPKTVTQSKIVITNKLTKEEREIDVIFIPVKDNTAIDLSQDTDGKIRAALAEIAERAKREDRNILVHCRAGMGRTGGLITGITCANDAKAIYGAKNVAEAASVVVEDVYHVRGNRMSLMQESCQLLGALQVAETLYRHDLEHNKVQTEEPAAPAAELSTLSEQKEQKIENNESENDQYGEKAADFLFFRPAENALSLERRFTEFALQENTSQNPDSVISLRAVNGISTVVFDGKAKEKVKAFLACCVESKAVSQIRDYNSEGEPIASRHPTEPGKLVVYLNEEDVQKLGSRTRLPYDTLIKQCKATVTTAESYKLTFKDYRTASRILEQYGVSESASRPGHAKAKNPNGIEKQVEVFLSKDELDIIHERVERYNTRWQDLPVSLSNL